MTDTFEALIDDIRKHRVPLESLSERFRKWIEQREAFSHADSNKKSGDFWKMCVWGDSLVRIRLLLEQNFNYIETIGVLAVSRYLFELTVWLKLLQADSQYGLVYYCELLKNQQDFYEALQKNAEREISFLQQIEKSENALLKSTTQEALQIPDEEGRNIAARQIWSKVSQQIDQDAARKFSLYAEQARSNGYGYQASLIETQVLPKHYKAIEDIKRELETFRRDLSDEVKKLLKEGWNWKKQAIKVGMGEEYDFIYLFASLLMHAKPASITTDHKNLEPAEMKAFLKYIRVRLLDVIEMAEEPLSNNPAVVQ
jgi:hypothetical protein